MQIRRSRRWLAVPLAGALALAACGDDDDDDAAATAAPRHRRRQRPAPRPTDDRRPTPRRRRRPARLPTRRHRVAPAGGVDLSADCPETVVIQTDWNPEAEHGWIYEMIGDGYSIDKGGVSVTGPLVASGGADTGVDLQIRSGGPAIGFQTVTSQLYTDDEHPPRLRLHRRGIQNAAEFPTVAILAGMEKNPQMIMWDPETYPDVHDDRGHRRGRASSCATSAARRTWTSSPRPGSCRPTRSTAATTARRRTSSPPRAPTPSRASGRPSRTSTRTRSPTGASRSPTTTSTTPAGRTTPSRSPPSRRTSRRTGRASRSWCRSSSSRRVDYIGDPAETNALIIEAVETFDNGWVYSEGVADYAVETMQADGLLGNGPDETVGNFDLDRVNELIEKARPVYAALGQEPPAISPPRTSSPTSSSTTRSGFT